VFANLAGTFMQDMEESLFAFSEILFAGLLLHEKNTGNAIRKKYFMDFIY
jgi:hypothetical protein